MAEVIGPFAIDGTPEQIATVRGMAQKLSGVLGARISTIGVVFRPGDQLKKKAGTKFTPRGLTLNDGHRILMHESIEDYDVDRTFAHEVMHCLDHQWFTDQQRLDICALMVPVATQWDAKDYRDRAYEAFACYASAALGGFRWPVYTEFYDHKVPKTSWPALADLSLKDYGPATPAPEPEPTPTDPRDQQIADLQHQVDVLSATVESLGALNEELKAQVASDAGVIASLQSQIAAAKTALQ